MLCTYISTTRRPIEVVHIVLAGDKHTLVYERATRPPGLDKTMEEIDRATRPPSLDETIEETDLPAIPPTRTRLTSPGTPPQAESESGAHDVGDIEIPAFLRPPTHTKG